MVWCCWIALANNEMRDEEASTIDRLIAIFLRLLHLALVRALTTLLDFIDSLTLQKIRS